MELTSLLNCTWLEYVFLGFYLDLPPCQYPYVIQEKKSFNKLIFISERNAKSGLFPWRFHPHLRFACFMPGSRRRSSHDHLSHVNISSSLFWTTFCLGAKLHFTSNMMKKQPLAVLASLVIVAKSQLERSHLSKSCLKGRPPFEKLWFLKKCGK